MKVFVKGQGSVHIDKRHFVAKGGEGDIYVRGDVAYKLFHDPHKAIAPSKMRELAEIRDDHVVKPEALLSQTAGGPSIGYAMPFVRDTEPLCRLFPRTFKERHGLDAAAVYQLIEQLATRIRSVHAAGALVVDMNDMNFLVRLSTRTVFAIDVDSYQTPSHPATAIMPSIQDPRTLSMPFDEASDWFSFAVLSFQLLIGVHPFKGKHASVKGLFERMQRGLCALDPSVTLPPVAYPLSIIPDTWAAWYRAVLGSGDRQPPPPSMTGAPAAVVSAPVQTTATLTSKLLHELPTEIRSTLPLASGGLLMLAADGVYVDDRRIGEALPRGAVLGVSPKGGVLSAWCDAGRLVLFHVTQNVHLETALGAEAVMSIRGRIYLKHEDKVVELIVQDVGTTVVASSRWVGRVLPKATHVHDGVLFQSLLGACYASLFPSSGAHVQVRLPELDGWQVLEARADGDARLGMLLVVVARDRDGNDCRLVFRVASDGRYDVTRHALSSPTGAACAVLDAGLAIVLDEDGNLEAFPVAVSAAGRRLIDASLSAGVHLSDQHGQLLCTRGECVYRLTSHGQTNRHSPQKNLGLQTTVPTQRSFGPT